MPKRKIPTKKNEAALALAKLSASKRYKTMTAAQRSEQGRMAGAARRDRQPKGPWFGLVVLPADFVWKGARHASKVLDEAAANPQVLFWSTDRAEVVARSQQADLAGRNTLIIEQDWDPKTLTVRRTFVGDEDAELRTLRALVGKKGGA